MTLRAAMLVAIAWGFLAGNSKPKRMNSEVNLSRSRVSKQDSKLAPELSQTERETPCIRL